MAEEYEGVRFSVAGFTKQDLPVPLLPLASEIEAACRAVEKAGFAKGIAGNLSARCKYGFLITPTGKGLANVSAADVVLVESFDFDKNVLLKARGAHLPSSETPMHSLIYEKMEGVGAIAHVHADVAGVPVTAQALPYGTQESALAALGALQKAPVIVMKGHGAVAVGAGIGDAVAKILKRSSK